jgi:hypothetical protein
MIAGVFPDEPVKAHRETVAKERASRSIGGAIAGSLLTVTAIGGWNGGEPTVAFSARSP